LHYLSLVLHLAQMNNRIGWLLFFVSLTGFVNVAYSQQDVDFHLNAHLFAGKKILKVKRDFNDPYLWVLAQNNQVYRVNSLTLAVDDYTAKFSAYSSLPFIDIAGKSKDTVFVATNSTNIIEYRSGAFHTIGNNDGIPGTVNSIGISNGYVAAFQYGPSTLLVGTDKGFRNYDPATSSFVNQTNAGDSRIYQSTYRTRLYKDSSDQTTDIVTGDTIQYQPIRYWPGDFTQWIEYLWEGGNEFGYNIRTATGINTALNGGNGVFATLFWGNNRGMFQSYGDYSYYSIYFPSGHYLDGIGVNKIADIYGLTAFGGQNTHQNLLIGTDKGFYFSSNIYANQGAVYMHLFTLYHDDELGNIVINDVCVNPAFIRYPSCEDGVWLAADDGLYLVKPDYEDYLNSKTTKAISFNSQPDTLSAISVCAGDSVVSIVTPYTFSGINVQWYKDGNELPAQTKDSLTINTTGDYYAVLYDPCSGIHLNSNHLRVDVITAPVFSFNYPDKIQQCGNTPTPLQTDNNPLYHYRWYTNGALNGDTTASYQVTQTGKYKVEVSACANSWIPSKEVEVDLITLPIPQIATDKPVYCAGDVASLSVNVPADNSYTINWYRDNVLLPADNNLTTIQDTIAGSYTVSLNSTAITCSQMSPAQQLSFTPAPYFVKDLPDEYRSCETSVPITIISPPSPNTVFSYRWYTNGVLNGSTGDSFTVDKSGKYRVEMSSCAGSWVSSHEVQIDLVNLPTPAVSSDKPVYCVGDNATLSVNVPVDASYTINWYRDGELLTANMNKTSVITDVAGSYTASVINNLQNTDGTTCLQTSTAQVLTFNPPATVSIEQIVKTTICDGQIINLLAHYTGGTLKWSTGETTDQINVTTAGKYTATVTTAAGCTEDTSISVSFLPNPIFSVKDTSVCPYKGQPITLTAPDGFAKYAWNGVPGGQTYQVTQPQTVQLTVTDINGCQTTLPIKVADHCPEIWIPNTFTPNNDGVNDTWVIEGLDGDPTVSVSVYTRWGSLVFQSNGYGTPWNGQYQGKKLPAGVYYYLVKAKNGGQKFSGPLTIIY